MWLYQQGDGDESQAVIDYVVGKMAEEHSKGLVPWRKVKREKILADLNRLFGTLMSVANGACPVDAGLDPKELKYGDWIAPARMDLAVTYRCNLECPKCYVGDRKVDRELSFSEWVKVYEILWKVGIPQVVFTGGEPTMRDDIVELVGQADEFVTGLVTNGTRLSELAQPLREASLDYAQVTVESFDPKIHDRITCSQGSHAKTLAGIKKALGVGLQVVTNTTLTKTNAASFTETIEWLHGLGIKNVACNTLICSGHGVEHKKENGLGDAELKGTLDRGMRDRGKAGDDAAMVFSHLLPPGNRSGRARSRHQDLLGGGPQHDRPAGRHGASVPVLAGLGGEHPEGRLGLDLEAPDVREAAEASVRAGGMQGL